MSTPHGCHRAWLVTAGEPQLHGPMKTMYEVLEKKGEG